MDASRRMKNKNILISQSLLRRSYHTAITKWKRELIKTSNIVAWPSQCIASQLRSFVAELRLINLLDSGRNSENKLGKGSKHRLCYSVILSHCLPSLIGSSPLHHRAPTTIHFNNIHLHFQLIAFNH